MTNKAFVRLIIAIVIVWGVLGLLQIQENRFKNELRRQQTERLFEVKLNR